MMINKKYTVNYRTLIIGIADLGIVGASYNKVPYGFGYFDTLEKAAKYAKSKAAQRKSDGTKLDYII